MEDYACIYLPPLPQAEITLCFQNGLEQVHVCAFTFEQDGRREPVNLRPRGEPSNRTASVPVPAKGYLPMCLKLRNELLFPNFFRHQYGNCAADLLFFYVTSQPRVYDGVASDGAGLRDLVLPTPMGEPVPHRGEADFKWRIIRIAFVFRDSVLCPRDHWQPDNEVAKCNACGRGFWLLLRRHHCRICGGLFCDRCSSNCITIESQSHRACRKCFEPKFV